MHSLCPDNKTKNGEAVRDRLFWVFGFLLLLFFGLSFIFMQQVDKTYAATPPSIITYQGKLLESGSSVTTSKNMAFLIYDASTGGNLLYTAAGTVGSTSTISVTPTSGIFSVNLGDTGTNSLNPSIFADNASLYFEVIIDGTTLSPRKRITSAPYATNAQYLLGYSPATASTSQYIALSNTDGNFTFTGTPTSTGVGGGIVYINPSSATANFTLFGVALNGAERFRIDEDGDTWIDGALSASTTLTVGATTTISGNAFVGNSIEAITTSSFIMNGDDMYIHDLLGVGNSLYVENSLYIGTSTLRLNGSNAGGVIAMRSGSLTLDSDTLLNINTTNNQNVIFGSGNIGINSTTPAYLFSVQGNGYFSGTVTATNWFAGNAITLGGVARTTWPTGGGGDSAWTTSTNLLYPDNPTTDIVVIGSNVTTTDAIFQVSGSSYFQSGTSTFDGYTSLIGNANSPVHAGSTVSTTNAANQDIVVQGQYAYIVRDDIFFIYDVSNPSSPSELGSVANAAGVPLDDARALAVSGNFAYVAAGTSDTLSIIDISNPRAPTFAGSIANGGAVLLDEPGDVEVSGNYAYVTARVSSALTVIDVSNPYSPVHVASLQDNTDGANLGNASSIFVEGNYAYVTAFADNALQVIDISNPQNPDPRGSVTNITDPEHLFVADGYAYVVDGFSGLLRIIDVGNPDSLTQVGTIEILDGGRVTVSGDYAYVSMGFNGDGAVRVIDVSDPTNVSTVTTITHDAVAGVLLYNPENIYFAGEHLYVETNNDAGTSDALTVFHVGSGSLGNARAGGLRTQTIQVTGGSHFGGGVHLDGGLSVGNSGLLLSGDLGFNIRTSTVNATNTTRFSHTALFESVASTSENYAFVFDTYNTLANTASLFSIRNNGTQYFNLSGSGTSTISEVLVSNGITLGGVRRTTWPSGGAGGAWTTSTNIVYPNNTTDVVVIGKTSTSSATTIFEVEGHSYFNGNIGIASTTPNYALSVSGTAFISATTTVRGGPARLIGRALSGVVVGSSTISSLPQVVRVVGDYAYVGSADGGSEFRIFDISNPNYPRQLGALSTADVEGLAVHGRYVYISSDSPNRLEVIDIANPSAPFVVASTSAGLSAQPGPLDIVGNYLFLGESGNIHVYDISNPASPNYIVSATETGMSDIRDVTVYGQHLYVTSDIEDRLRIFDISDPRNLFHTGSLASTTGVLLGGPREVVVRGGYAYVAGADSNGVEIVDVSDPTNPTHAGAVQGTLSGTMVVTPLSLKLSGDYLYVNDTFYDVISVLDVSSSTNPVFLGPLVSSTNSTFIDIQGGYLYSVNSVINDFQIIDVTGANITNAEVGTLKTNHLSVMDRTDFSNSVAVHGGLSVGSGGFLLSGDFSMNAVTTTQTATNTLRFSHTALFTSRAASNTVNHAFIFDTDSTWSSSTSKYLLSLRTGGTPAFSVAVNGDVHTSGTLYAASATVGTPGAPGDLAERVDIAIDDVVGAGDVVIVDPNNTDTYRRSRQAYSERVAGIISTNPTIVIGSGKTTSTAVLAMTGRVPVKVTLEGGSISRGDLLVSASTTGHAMRYDPTRDPGTRIVGIIGMALDSFTGTSSSTASSTSGSVLALIRTGWVYNQYQTISQMQSELAALAAAQSPASENSGSALTVTQAGGQILLTNQGHLDLGWKEIRRVMAIRGRAWEIDAQGRFVTRVDAGDDVSLSLYAVQSQGTQLILSGSSILEHGRARIDFSTSTRNIIDTEKPIRVSIALTSQSNGMYVENKSEGGFDVRELNNGRTGNATFDWVAIVERRIDVTPAQIQQAVEEAQHPIPSIDSESEQSEEQTEEIETPTPTSTPQTGEPEIETTSSTEENIEEVENDEEQVTGEQEEGEEEAQPEGDEIGAQPEEALPTEPSPDELET